MTGTSDPDVDVRRVERLQSRGDDTDWLAARTRELMANHDLKWPQAWRMADRELFTITGRTAPKWTTSTWLRVVLGLAAVSTVVLFVSALAIGEDPDAAQARVDLISELDMTVSPLSIPGNWEIEGAGAAGFLGGIAYRASPDLSSSGTWMIVSVTQVDASEGASTSEELFWQAIDRVVAEGSGRTVHEPIEASASGLPGYLFEVSGLTGYKTGQELGAYVAVFFGAEYTYEVIIQFELSDRDDMSVLYRGTLADLSRDN